MKILISGAGGLVGSGLVPALRKSGNDVQPLVRFRKGMGDNEFWWKAHSGEINLQALNSWGGPDAMVHLAGENIAKRWSEQQKRAIRESRVEATERLCDSLLRLRRRPSTFVSASAIGFYGNRGDEVLVENSPRGIGFLSEVTVDWEKASGALVNADFRVAHLRFGMILSREGGALARMLPVFRLGFGGKIGDGRQWMSWISRTDVIRIMRFTLETPGFSGACNAVSPGPIRNVDFTKALARSLRRPAFFRVPAWVLRLALGQMAEELLLTSQRVLPKRISEAGFEFQHPTIEKALAGEL